LVLIWCPVATTDADIESVRHDLRQVCAVRSHHVKSLPLAMTAVPDDGLVHHGEEDPSSVGRDARRVHVEAADVPYVDDPSPVPAVKVHAPEGPWAGDLVATACGDEDDALAVGSERGVVRAPVLGDPRFRGGS